MMKLITLLKNKLNASKYKRQDLKIIERIPAHTFSQIIASYRKSGWEQTDAYRAFEATHKHWYCNLRKGSSVLRCHWRSNETGSISGLTRIVEPLGAQWSLSVSDAPGSSPGQ